MKYLPKLATGEFMGCFGLTEPNYGSDPGSMITNFKDMGDHYLLNGVWISNAPFADIAVVWAKDERKNSRTYRRTRYGRFSTPETHNKWSLISTGELIFDNVKVPKKICYQTNLV
jgi:glutaryl-CoA dehydrogenase